MAVRWREIVRRSLPPAVRRALVNVRDQFAEPPFEDTVLHEYRMTPDQDRRPRLSLVMPSIDPAWAFGGVTTAIDIFFELCHRTGAQARIITDGMADDAVVARRAAKFGLTPEYLVDVGRPGYSGEIPVRATDIFLTYNWWTTVNIRPLLDGQVQHFGGARLPFIYLLQDYEPSFYEFSSTHMLARMALEQDRPCWGVYNSSQLHDFFVAQGHGQDRDYVFEPKLNASLRPALDAGPTPKSKRILVYGRPTIQRNCFPALEKGLRLWAETHPEFADWDVVSAGITHKPIQLGANRAVRSVGMLPLDGYADLLRTTAVGLSLMSSPHPSYPPLEMAHFGLLTITNRYANKDLSSAHDNFVSIADIDARTIADALAESCRRFEADPDAGWRGRSYIPWYTNSAEWAFLAELSRDLDSLLRGLVTAPTSVAPAAD
jgi:hypothetical protein